MGSRYARKALKMFSTILATMGVIIFLVACSSSKTETNTTVEKQETPQVSPSFQKNYDEIYQKGLKIEDNYKDLKVPIDDFLQKNPGLTELEKDQCMQIAVIGAAAFYLDDDLASASRMASKAYGYTISQQIRFPQEWDVEKWLKLKDYKIAKKLVQMKDFIISKSNGGFPLFQEGNKAFISHAKYQAAVEKYQEALSKGIEDNRSRKQCYIYLTACLFKTEKVLEAEKVFLGIWLYDRNDIEPTFGDLATKEFINSLKAKYTAQYPE